MGKLFGTDGVRGEANRYPMNAEIAFAIDREISGSSPSPNAAAAARSAPRPPDYPPKADAPEVMLARRPSTAKVKSSAGRFLTILAKKVAGKVIPPVEAMTSWALVSDCSMRVSMEISLFEPVKINSSCDKTILIFVKIGINIKAHTTSTSFS